MKLETMWCVIDPMPMSELADVLFEATPERLAHIITGMSMVRSRAHLVDSLSVYTTHEEARADAEARLAKRDAAR
ncbi:hypothetical protein [Sorangium sp. So ce1024]|uniref:hypothetical protein n=1 Tax=Sorangium sp. So ce1024 TaxID=3133327 RepID=UPI003F077BBC